MSNVICVTRHQGLVEYLRELGLIDADTPVYDHVYPADVHGNCVIGVLPIALASCADAVLEVPLALSRYDRAQGDLSVERVRKIAGRPVVFIVRRYQDFTGTALADLGDGARDIPQLPKSWKQYTRPEEEEEARVMAGTCPSCGEESASPGPFCRDETHEVRA